MSNTYSDVHNSADVGEAMDWQDRVDAWPQTQAYKDRSAALIESKRPVLDIGCGTGHDLATLAPHAIGIDSSQAMCARAHARGRPVARADAASLPFEDRTFGATRADRVLQHVAEPEAVLAEMIRVTRTGGRVVICDPDQETLVISVPGVRPELCSAVKRLRRDIGYRNGDLASRLPSLLLQLGLSAVTVDAFPLLLTNPDDAFGLPGWVRHFGHAHACDRRPHIRTHSSAQPISPSGTRVWPLPGARAGWSTASSTLSSAVRWADP